MVSPIARTSFSLFSFAARLRSILSCATGRSSGPDSVQAQRSLCACGLPTWLFAPVGRLKSAVDERLPDRYRRSRPASGDSCSGESAQALDDGGIGHAAALAHGLEAVAAAPALQLVKHGGHQFGPRGAQGVADGDRSPVGV